MSCPNCDHTMHGLGETDEGYHFFWCPLCGTLRDSPDGDWDESRLTPGLVGRVREFVDGLNLHPPYEYPNRFHVDELRQIGVLESIDFERRKEEQDDA